MFGNTSTLLTDGSTTANRDTSSRSRKWWSSNNGLDVYVPPRSPLKNKAQRLDASRTEEAFGKEALAKLSLIDVAILGASGIGGPLIEMVARDNYNSLTIADPDTIDASNLNRLPGTTLEDIGKNKAQHYAELRKKDQSRHRKRTDPEKLLRNRSPASVRPSRHRFRRRRLRSQAQPEQALPRKPHPVLRHRGRYSRRKKSS